MENSCAEKRIYLAWETPLWWVSVNMIQIMVADQRRICCSILFISRLPQRCSKCMSEPAERSSISNRHHSYLWRR
jgi:hypothetical protein